MSNPKLTRVLSIRERVEDTLLAHRNELVSLLSRFTSLFLVSWLRSLKPIRVSESYGFDSFLCFWLGRYVAQGKGILQPHHLIDELENVVGDDKGRQKLTDGVFSEVLKSAQVKLALQK